MRKLIALFLLLLCPLLPAQALTLPYPEDTILSVINLTPSQRALADYLYEPIFFGRERIDLPKGTRYDDVQPAMLCLMADYPELFHLGHQYSTHCYADQPEYATALSPQYIMTTEEAATLRAELYVRAYLMADARRIPWHCTTPCAPRSPTAATRKSATPPWARCWRASPPARAMPMP